MANKMQFHYRSNAPLPRGNACIGGGNVGLLSDSQPHSFSSLLSILLSIFLSFFIFVQGCESNVKYAAWVSCLSMNHHKDPLFTRDGGGGCTRRPRMKGLSLKHLKAVSHCSLPLKHLKAVSHCSLSLKHLKAVSHCSCSTGGQQPTCPCQCWLT